MISVNDLKVGNSILVDNFLYQVLDVSHNKTAMRQMIIKAKVRNMRTGSITELTFTGGDRVEKAHIETKKMQYLYDDQTSLVFMDVETYEQIEILKEKLEWELKFLKENDFVSITSFEGEILGVALPDKVALAVIESEPAVKGDTATGAMKNAVLETGLEIKVPLFIETGEVILVTTAEGKYSSRDK